MSKPNKTNRVARLRRGMASTVLLATLALQVAPLATVSATTIEYEHEGVDKYITSGISEYVIKVNPMINVGNVNDGQITPKGGSYQVEQIAQYTSSGKREEVTGAPQTITLTDDGDNDIKLSSDGEYKITPVQRIPGFLKDLGATKSVDAIGGDTKLDEPAGHYIYALPLITNGVPSDIQEVDFQPKLEEARTTLEIEKLGDDGKPLPNVHFTVYKTYDAQLDVTYANGAEEVVQVSTGSDGKITVGDLIEGKYYFVEEVDNVPATYLPDSRKIEFDVRVGEDEQTVSIVATDNKDIATVGNNKRGYQTGDTITRFNYIDPAQNVNETYQSVFGKDYWGEYSQTTQGYVTGSDEGIVYVNTDGTVEFSSSVDIPKNFNDFETFDIVDTVDNKLTIDPSTIELRVLDNDEGVLDTIALGSNDALVHDGQTISINAKSSAISSILEDDGVDLIVLTYKANVDTNDIAENVVHEVLTNTQTINTDSELTDATNPDKTTVNTTEIRVREGRIVIDKETNDGENTPLKDADFQLYEPTDGAGEITSHGKNWVKANNPRGEKDNYFGTTDEDGQLVFENVPYGEYLIVETRAPDGYRLNNNHQLVEIKDDGDVVSTDGVGNTLTQTITNMRRNQIFPGTGTTGNIITLVVLAVAGGSLVYVTVKKKKEGEEETEQA